jgi:serine/threonine-protein kinase
VVGQTAAVILVKHLTETPAPSSAVAPDTPPVLAVAVDAALRKSPAERPTAAELAAACDAALAGVTLAAPAAADTAAWLSAASPAGGVSPAAGTTAAVAAPAAPRRRPRWRARLAALAAGLAVVAGGWWAAARPAAPAANDGRSYLVVPFEVRSADERLGWLRDASASLLTLDLGQWTDLTVVEYERTLDLLREAHLDDDRRLGLEDARRVGRRAGVGTVVMGEVTGTADSLLVVARLYDVETGRRLEQAQRSAARGDDPRPLFAALARDLLDLAGVATAGAASSGGPASGAERITSSLAAYRAYLEGVRALNAWRLDRADSLFGAAVAADSTSPSPTTGARWPTASRRAATPGSPSATSASSTSRCATPAASPRASAT